MAGKTVTLSGWKLVLVVLVLGSVAAFRVVTARAQMDTQGRDQLQRWVQAEVVRPILADTTRSVAARDSALLLASSVTIKSLKVHGSLQNAVVRVELNPSPALPPGAPLVRYYRARYSQLTGWTHHGSATSLKWYLAVF